VGAEDYRPQAIGKSGWELPGAVPVTLTSLTSPMAGRRRDRQTQRTHAHCTTLVPEDSNVALPRPI